MTWLTSTLCDLDHTAQAAPAVMAGRHGLPPAVMLGHQDDQRQRRDEHPGEDQEHVGLRDAGIGLLDTMAAVIDTAVMAPDCRNMPRSPATAAVWSGASCSVALFEAGVEMPMPTPQTQVATASQE